MALDILNLQFSGKDDTKQAIASVNSGINSIKANIDGLNKGGLLSGLKSGFRDGIKEVGGLKSAFNNLKSNGDSVFSALYNQINKTTSGLINVAKYAGVAGGGLLSLGLIKGLKISAEIEQTVADLEVLTGSAENARKVFEGLKKFADVSPFTSSDLIGTANRLATVEKNADLVILRTKQLGEASGGNAAKMDLMALAYTQVAGKGKLLTQELNQMTDAGFFTLRQELQKVTGLAGDSFTKALEGGKISLEDLNKALDNSTQGFPRLTKASQTFNGKLSTLSDTFNTFLNDVVAKSGVFDVAKVAIEQLTKVLTGNTSLSNALGEVGSKISNFIPENIKTQTSQIIGSIGLFVGKLTNLSEKLGITDILSGFINTIKSLGDELAKIDFKKVINDIGGFFDSIDIDLVRSLATAIGLVGGALLGLSVGASILGGLVGLFGLLFNPITVVTAAITGLAFAWSKNFLGIRDTSNNVITFIRNLLTGIVNFFTVSIPTALNTLRITWDTIWRGISSAFSIVMTGIKNIFITVFNSISQFFTDVANSIIRGVNTIIDTVNRVTGQSISKLQELKAVQLSLEEPIDINVNTDQARQELRNFFASARSAINEFSKNQVVVDISNKLGLSGARKFVQGVTGGDTGGVISESGVFKRMAGGTAGLIPTGRKGKHGENGYLMEVHGGEHILNPKIPKQREMLERAYQINSQTQPNINITINSNQSMDKHAVINEVTRQLRLAI